MSHTRILFPSWNIYWYLCGRVYTSYSSWFNNLITNVLFHLSWQFVTVFKCNSISKHFSQFNLLHLPTYTCMQVSLISHVSRREFTFSLMLLVENENNVVEGWLPLIFSWTFYFTFFKIPSGSEIRTIFSRSSEKNEPNSHENSQDWEFLLCSDRHLHAVVIDTFVQVS